MTLIVGRVLHGKIYLIGETELTFFNQKNSNPYVDGCLKQYIINDNLAIGFSGTVEHFAQVLPDILACKNSNQITEIALEAASNGLKFDLLIGEVGKDKLHIVKDGEVSESQAGYVGDSEAFNAFQIAYRQAISDPELQAETARALIQILRLPEPIIDDEIYSYLYKSLKEVILDRRISGVGGAIIPLCTDKGKFRYLNYVDITSDQLSIEDFHNEPRAIEFGTAAGGGFAFDLDDDIPFGGSGTNVGFYFLQGGFGVTFPSNKDGLRCARLVRAKNPAYWILQTTKELGHGIGCGFLTEDHCGIAGEELLKEQKFEDALFCYELKKDSPSLQQKPAVFDRYITGYATAMFNSGYRQNAVSVLTSFIERQSESRNCKAILDRISKIGF